MLIKELMQQPVQTVRRDDTLAAATRVMWEHDCGAVPVVDDDGHLAGMLTDRDACMAAYLNGRALDAIPVARAMAADVVACSADDDVVQAEEHMRSAQIRRIPVIDRDRKVIGMLSLNDLARAATAKDHQPDTARLISVARTLGAVCQPRTAVRRVEAPAAAKPQPARSPPRAHA